MSDMPKIAVLGAGHMGPIIARVAVEAGYPVSIAASGDPTKIALIAQVLAPGAEPLWAADAVADADLVVLSMPVHRFTSLDPELVADKLVVDTMNYWPPIDGVVPMFDEPGYGSSEIVARRLSRSTIVKTFNHIGYHELDEERQTAGSPLRRALGVAGDDPTAVDTVAEVVERIGYDTVRLTSLRAARILEPGGPVFGVPLHRAEFERALHTDAITVREGAQS